MLLRDLPQDHRCGGFAINLGGDHDTLQIDGRDHLRVYQARLGESAAEPSPAQRHFCGRCGTHPWLWDPRWPELIHPLASAIDTPLPVPPQRTHLMLASKAPWVQVHTGPQDRQHADDPDESIAEWHERLGLVS